MQVIQSALLVQFRRTSVHLFFKYLMHTWSYSTPSKNYDDINHELWFFSYVAPYRDRKPKNRNITIDSVI